MIAEKIKCKKEKSKTAHVKDLCEYIMGLKKTRGSTPKTTAEKVLFSGALNFISDTFRGNLKEMTALAMEAIASPNPLNHWVLSWPDNESPTRAQVEDCVQMLLKEFGMTDHQCMFAAHADTDNLHVHIALNRVHPVSGRAIEINRGFDILEGHKAIAKMEHKHGFKPVLNALFTIDENGEAVPSVRNKFAKKKANDTAKKIEVHTNEKSAESIGIEKTEGLFRKVSTWPELHEQLKKRDMAYEKKGSGAVIKVGSIYCKASSISHGATLSKLEKKLGPFVPSVADPAKELDEVDKAIADIVSKIKPMPEPIKHSPMWVSYCRQKDIYFHKKQIARKLIEDKYQTKFDLIQNFKTDRYKFFANQSWRGRGYLLNALKAEVAAEVKQQKLLLAVQKKAEMGEFYRKFEPYPRFEDWLKVWNFNVERHMQMKNQNDESDVLIFEDRRPQNASKMPRNLDENTTEFLKFFDKLQTQEDLKKVEALSYNQAKKQGLTVENFDYLGKGFYDAGTKVVVNAKMEKQEENVRQALAYAAKKFGNSLYINGDESFKIAAAKMAVKLGIEVQNPELQNIVAHEKQLLKLRENLRNSEKSDHKKVEKKEPENGFSGPLNVAPTSAVAVQNTEAQVETKEATQQAPQQKPEAQVETKVDEDADDNEEKSSMRM